MSSELYLIRMIAGIEFSTEQHAHRASDTGFLSGKIFRGRLMPLALAATTKDCGGPLGSLGLNHVREVHST